MLQLNNAEGFYRKKFESVLITMGYDRKTAKSFVRKLGQAIAHDPGAVKIQPTEDGKISIFFEVFHPKTGSPQKLGVSIPADLIELLQMQVQ